MRYRPIVALALAIPGVPVSGEPLPPLTAEQIKVLMPEGEALEVEKEGDLTGDGVADIALVSYGMDVRTLRVLRTDQGEVHVEHAPIGTADLDAFPHGPAELSIAKGVLKVVDLTGGTTATQATYRYRYDPKARKMRLIGLDATNYSRTYAHDGFEFSWNLLTGDIVTRELKLNRKGGDAAYLPAVDRRGKRPSKPLYLADTPSLDDVIASLRR